MTDRPETHQPARIVGTPKELARLLGLTPEAIDRGRPWAEVPRGYGYCLPPTPPPVPFKSDPFHAEQVRRLTRHIDQQDKELAEARKEIEHLKAVRNHLQAKITRQMAANNAMAAKLIAATRPAPDACPFSFQQYQQAVSHVLNPNATGRLLEDAVQHTKDLGHRAADQLGDALYAVAYLATQAGLDLGRIAQANQARLAALATGKEAV